VISRRFGRCQLKGSRYQSSWIELQHWQAPVVDAFASHLYDTKCHVLLGDKKHAVLTVVLLSLSILLSPPVRHDSPALWMAINATLSNILSFIDSMVIHFKISLQNDF